MEKDSKQNKNKKIISKKFIILTRHGQRIDLGPNPFEQKFPQDDPELTQLGREQAEKMAELIKGYMLQTHNFNITATNTQIISSPFSRTIQTSFGLIKGYGFNSGIKKDDIGSKYKLHIDNDICELIFHGIVNNLPSKFLSLYNKPLNEKKFINKFQELEGETVNTLDKYSPESLPKKFEIDNNVYIRLENSFFSNKKRFLDLDSKSPIEVIQFVSHAGVLASLKNILMKNILETALKMTVDDSLYTRFPEYNKGYVFDDYSYFDYSDTELFMITVDNTGEEELINLGKLELPKK